MEIKMTKQKNIDIEIGDIVTVVGGEFDGLSGELINIWFDEGIEKYVVSFSDADEDFVYATAVKPFK